MHDDGLRISTKNKYNFLNQLIQSTNALGHETFYEFDDLGRTTAVRFPAVPNKMGVLYEPVIKTEYDIVGNPTSITDPEGNVIRTEYNIRGKPVHIYYPDGSQEHFFYELNGCPRKSRTQWFEVPLYE